MQRFFADPSRIDEETGEIRIGGTDVNHIRNVLRMRTGDELWISDGEQKEYHCTIRDYTEDEVILQILYAQEPEYELPCDLYLYQCVAVELGAAGIIPVESSRCIVRLDEKKAEKRQKRWQQIAEGAAKQSRRMRIPVVEPVLSFKKALEQAKSLDLLLIPYELEKGMKRTREVLQEVKPGRSVGILIGPEGGFEPQEVALAKEAGAVPISLGRRILRTETAGMTLLSVLMFRLEEE